MRGGARPDQAYARVQLHLSTGSPHVPVPALWLVSCSGRERSTRPTDGPSQRASVRKFFVRPLCKRSDVVGPQAAPLCERCDVVAPQAAPLCERSDVVAPPAAPLCERSDVVAPLAERLSERLAHSVTDSAPLGRQGELRASHVRGPCFHRLPRCSLQPERQPVHARPRPCTRPSELSFLPTSAERSPFHAQGSPVEHAIPPSVGKHPPLPSIVPPQTHDMQEQVPSHDDGIGAHPISL